MVVAARRAAGAVPADDLGQEHPERGQEHECPGRRHGEPDQGRRGRYSQGTEHREDAQPGEDRTSHQHDGDLDRARDQLLGPAFTGPEADHVVHDPGEDEDGQGEDPHHHRHDPTDQDLDQDPATTTGGRRAATTTVLPKQLLLLGGVSAAREDHEQGDEDEEQIPV